MPRKILAPHKEQDGWVYWRVRATTGKNAANAPTVNPLWLVRKDTLECVKASDIGIAVGYLDLTPTSRIIASRRVERAVERDDFLKLCSEEGLTARYYHRADGDYGWLVGPHGAPDTGWYDNTTPIKAGTTLREAYYRYKAEAELDAQQPGPFGNETEPVDDERYCFNCYFEDTPDDGKPCHDCMSDDNAHDEYGDWTRPEWRSKND